MLWQEYKEVEYYMVVVVVTITKANCHTRVYAKDAEYVGDVAVQINVCDLTTNETHPKELIGCRISSMNQGFIPSLRQNRRTNCMKYAIAEAPPSLKPER